MRFRITHILLLTILIAFLATALANPTAPSAALVQLLAWFLYTTLAFRASVRPGVERQTILGALTFGLS
jgi:hypothetical protein